jgi:hypothetical protein
VRKLTDLLADRLLPVRQLPDVFVDPRICAHATYCARAVGYGAAAATTTVVTALHDDRSHGSLWS